MEKNRILIQLVRSYPELYKQELRSAPYRRVSSSNAKVIEIWKTIADKLSLDSAAEAEARWNELTKHYYKLKKENAEQDWIWPLMEELRFLDKLPTRSHNRRSEIVQPHFKIPAPATATTTSMICSSSSAPEEPIEVIMVEPPSPADLPAAIPTPHVVNMNRIETLFSSLDDANKIKAEKRVVTYLCLCQIKSLNNESVDDVII